MYLLVCVCTTLSWFVLAVASMYSSTVRLFYASSARVVLLTSTKFACKVVSIITLALWRDGPLSSYCQWYLPVDGAVLLWQAYVAPVGAAAQATIAAADAACTFCCCWLLSDRWPYDNISTGTVLAINLLLACASLWLADRMEQSDRRDYERALAASEARSGAATVDAGEGLNPAPGGKASGYVRAAAPVTAGCGIAGCSCGCGCGCRGSADASAEAVGGDGGKGVGAGLRGQAVATGKDAADVTPAEPNSPQQQQPQQPLPQQPREGIRSMDDCCCLARLPMTYPGGGAAAACARGGGGSFSSGSACGGGGGGTACSEVSSPATFSTTRSLSRALPSFSTLSNCSIIGGGGSISAVGLASETGGSSMAANRPSSCLGALLVGRTATTTGQLQMQPAKAGALAVPTVPPGPPGPCGVAAADCARTSASCPATTAAAAAAAASATIAAPRNITNVVAVDAADVAVRVMAPVAAPPPNATAARRPSFDGAASGGLVSSPALASADLAGAAVTCTAVELCESGGLHPTYALMTCDEERQEGGSVSGGNGGGSAAPPPSPAAGPGAVAPSPQSLPGLGSLSGAGPLQQLRRRVRSLVTRGDAASAGAAATLAAPSAAAEPLPAAKATHSGEASASGAASASGSVSYCSSTSRFSEPRLCSYQWQDCTATAAAATAAATAAAASLCGRGSASQRRGTAAAGPTGVEATPQRACSGHSDGDGASAGTGARATDGATAAAKEAWADSPAAAPPTNHLLVSADCVLAHPQPRPALADPAAALQRRRLQASQQSSSLRQFSQPPEPMAVVGFSALSADTVSTARPQQPQQAPRPLQATPAVAPARAEGVSPAVTAVRLGGAAAAASAAAAAGTVIAGGKMAMVPLATAAAAAEQVDAPPAALPPPPSPGAARHLTGGGGAAAAEAALSPCGTVHAAAVVPESRAPRCYALARALAARGGCNALYDAPALHHTRCNIKLDGLTPADLPYGFVDRVASLLAAAGGSAAAAMAAAAGHPAAATAALAAVGVYVREGCVELVADVVMPTGAAEAEALVVGMAADAAHGVAEGRGGGGARGAAALARMLAVAEDAAAAARLQQPQGAAAAAVAVRPDRAAAEAMLGLLERSLLPQISDAASSHPSTQGGALPAPPPLGGVVMQATVGDVQVTAWRAPHMAAAAAPPPPPTIVCVTPCCVPLVQASGDDTRDRRRQTLTLTVALAGFGVSADAAAPPRLFVRHSGRCLAAVVRPCAERYVGCLAVTVELALSGIRPGLLFLEVAAADGGAALSLPWPVLVVGDSRVASEVQQLQQHIEAVAPLRALQAEAEILQFLRQRGGGGGGDPQSQPQWQPGPLDPRGQQRQQQQQLDGGTTSLLLDFGMWFEAVSAADAAVIAAATGRPAVSERVAASPRYIAPAPPPAPLPLPLTPPVTASAAAEEVGEGHGAEGESETKEGFRQRDSGDGSSWESSSEEEQASDGEGEREAAASAALMAADRPPTGRVAAESPRAPHGGAAASCSDSCDGAVDVGSDAEVQMLLLRSIQPEQELLEGSLDCAAEYERSCRRGPALQSAAAGLGMRLLRFAVLRGWPAAATLLLRGLMVHCRLGFGLVVAHFPAAATAGGAGGGMPLLHTAVMSGSLAMVRAVKAWAQRYRAALPWDEAVPAAGGLTPLHLAAVQDNGRLASAILGLWPDAEAQWAVARDRDGRTPLEYAHMRAMTGSGGAVASSAAAPPPPPLPPGAELLLSGGPAARQRHGPQTGEMEEALAAPAQPPRAAPRPQQLQSRVGALAEGAPAGAHRPASGPYVVAIAPSAVQRRSRPPSPLLQEAAGGDGGAVASAAAADRGDGPGSCASSVLMSSLVPGGTCAGSGLSRLDRTSDCGSMSMGRDSQWSHSTNATAQMVQYSHLPTGTLQDPRGGGGSGHSPVKVSALSATLLSLANLPDGGGSGSSSDGVGAGGPRSGAAGASSGSGGTEAGVGVACLSNGSSGKRQLQQQQRQLMALTTTHGLAQLQQQQRLQAQPPQQQQPGLGGAVPASFQLDAPGGQKSAPSPPTLPPQLRASLSPQLQQVLQHHVTQQQLKQQQQQQQQGQTPQPRAYHSFPARQATHAGGSGSGGGLPVCGASPLGLRPTLQRQEQQQQQGEVTELRLCAQTLASDAQVELPGCAPLQARSPSPLTAGLGASGAESQPSPSPSALGAVDALACAGAAAGTHPAAASDVAVAVTPSPPPPPPALPSPARAAAAHQPPASTPLQQQSQHRAVAAAAVAAPPAPPRLRVSTRGVRLLATSLLHNGSASAGSPPRTASPPGSTGSPFSAAAAVGAYPSYSMRSTAGSVASTLSISNGTARRRASCDGRFSANPRRAAFADDYAPACHPTLAARTSQLVELLPLFSAAQRVPPSGGADRAAAAARAALLAAARTTSPATAAASATASDGMEGSEGPVGLASRQGWGGGGSDSGGGGLSLLPLSADSPTEAPAGAATGGTAAPGPQEARLPDARVAAMVAAAPPPPPRLGTRAEMHSGAEEAGAAAAPATAAVAQPVTALGKAPRLHPRLRLGPGLLLAAGVVLLAALVLPAIFRLMA